METKSCGLKVAFLLFVFCFTSAVASIGDVVLKEQKEEVIATIQIPSVDAMLKKVDALLEQMGMDSSGFKENMASELLKVSDATLIDFTKPMEIVVFNTKKYEIPVVLSFEVTNKEKFFEGFASGGSFTLNPKTKDAKIREYIETFTEFDHEAYMRDLEEGKEINFDDYNKEVTRSYFLGMIGNRAVGTGNMELMEKALTAAEKKILRKPVVTGDIQGAVNIDAVMTIYADEIEMMKSELLNSSQPPDSPIEIGKIMEMYYNAFMSIAKSTDALEYAASLSEGDIDLKYAMLPKAGTTFASILAKQTPGKFDYLKLMPENTSFAFAMNIDFTPELVQEYTSWTQQIIETLSEATGDALTEEDNKKLVSMIKDSLESYGKNGAFALAFTETGLDFRGIIQVKDRDKLVGVAKDSIDFMMKKMLITSEELQGFDVKYQEKADEYKGARIDKLTFEFDMEDIPEEGAEMVKKIFGEEMSMYLAYTDKEQVFGMGPKGLSAVKEIIDMKGTPPEKNLTTSSLFASSTKGYPEEGLFFMYLSLGSLMRGIMTMAPEEEKANAEMMMEFFDKLNLSGYVTKTDNALVFGSRLPLSAIMEAVMTVMMGMPEQNDGMDWNEDEDMED